MSKEGSTALSTVGTVPYGGNCISIIKDEREASDKEKKQMRGEHYEQMQKKDEQNDKKLDKKEKECQEKLDKKDEQNDKKLDKKEKECQEKLDKKQKECEEKLDKKEKECQEKLDKKQKECDEKLEKKDEQYNEIKEVLEKITADKKQKLMTWREKNMNKYMDSGCNDPQVINALANRMTNATYMTGDILKDSAFLMLYNDWECASFAKKCAQDKTTNKTTNKRKHDQIESDTGASNITEVD